MILPAAALLASTLYAGPEAALAEPVRDAQPYVQLAGDVAASEDVALVVWRDGVALRGARVDRDGDTLDATPLLIAWAPWEGAWLARGTTNWLVVTWQPDRVEATVVEADGTVRRSMLLATHPGWPRVAFDGTSYLVAWHSPTQRGRIFATRISAAGDIVESDIMLTGGPLDIIDLLPAPGGGFVLVGQFGEVVATRFDAELHAVSHTTLVAENIAYDAIAALDSDGRVAVAWKGAEAVHVKLEGSAAVSIPGGHPDDFLTARGILHVIVRSNDETSIRTLDGAVVRELPAAATARAATLGDRVLLATWDGDVHVTPLDALLETLAPERPVYTEPRLQMHPVVAVAGDTRLVAWREGDGDSFTIMARVGDGTPLVVGDGEWVDVATDGRDFLIAWRTGILTSFRGVLRDGTMAEPAAIDDWTWGDGCLTWTGADYVLGYVTVNAFPRVHLRSVTAQRVTRAGELSGDSVVVSGTRAIAGVECAATRATTLFAWHEELSNVVDASTLSRGGTVLGLHIGTGTSTSVASDGEGFAVAWAEHPAGRASWATVTEGGTVGLPHTIESHTIDVAARTSGYLLLHGTNPLVARTLDREGNPSGPEAVVAQDASEPAFSRGTLVYQRDVDILPQPRWQAFGREIVEAPRRRRAVR